MRIGFARVFSNPCSEAAELYMNQEKYWEDPHDIVVINSDILWLTTKTKVIEFNLKTEIVIAHISKDVFMSEVKQAAHAENTSFSASNLKNLVLMTGSY